MATFTPDTEYYITIEDQEKMIQAINKGSLKNANRDFHIDQKKHKPQEQNFLKKHFKKYNAI